MLFSPEKLVQVYRLVCMEGIRSNFNVFVCNLDVLQVLQAINKQP